MEIIAEIGQNHNGDMELARALIRAAKRHGADVAKFQLFDPDRIFTNRDDPWYAYNRQTELNQSQVAWLEAECRKEGIEFLASVFDTVRLGWLEELGVRRYKVASRSIRDHELLSALGETGKPLLVSLGMWSEPEFPTLPTSAPVDFLYCVSKYPTRLDEVRLSSVDFGRYSGFSDHTLGLSASIAALSRGARIIEKHFTLDKTMHGPDHAGSMTPAELGELHHFRQDLRALLTQ
jgi:sialic acid synthase SpsE